MLFNFARTRESPWEAAKKIKINNKVRIMILHFNVPRIICNFVRENCPLSAREDYRLRVLWKKVEWGMFWLTIDEVTKEWMKTQIKDLRLDIFHTFLKGEKSKRHEQGNKKCVNFRNKDVIISCHHRRPLTFPRGTVVLWHSLFHTLPPPSLSAHLSFPLCPPYGRLFSLFRF